MGLLLLQTAWEYLCTPDSFSFSYQMLVTIKQNLEAISSRKLVLTLETQLIENETAGLSRESTEAKSQGLHPGFSRNPLESCIYPIILPYPSAKN